MSTRSNIGILEKDKTVRMIYCHFDGYLSWVGKILLEHYTDESKVRELIALGDISSLCENVAPPPGMKHTYDTPIKNVAVAYYRDRGEPFEASSREYFTIEDARLYMQEYLYLFDVARNKWFFTDGKIGLVELTEELCKED